MKTGDGNQHWVHPILYYADLDGDGYGNEDAIVQSCNSIDYLTTVGVIATMSMTLFIPMRELCDGRLNNCNTTTDLIESNGNMIPDSEWDNDGDGFIECSPLEGEWGIRKPLEGQDYMMKMQPFIHSPPIVQRISMIVQAILSADCTRR